MYNKNRLKCLDCEQVYFYFFVISGDLTRKKIPTPADSCDIAPAKLTPADHLFMSRGLCSINLCRNMTGQRRQLELFVSQGI